MELVIPEGAQVHIIIGKPPLLALPDATAPTRTPARPGRGLLKGGLALVLVFGAFEAGRHVAARSEPPGATTAAMVMPGPTAALGAEQHAFANRPLAGEAMAAPATTSPAAASSPPAQVPPELVQQLQKPPTVIPPPGWTPPGAVPGLNAFGLEN